MEWSMMLKMILQRQVNCHVESTACWGGASLLPSDDRELLGDASEELTGGMKLLGNASLMSGTGCVLMV